MKRYVACTYFVDDSVYPNIGKGSAKGVQAVYWRNIAVMAASASRFAPDATVLVFTNATPPPRMVALFKQAAVQFIPAPFEHCPPEGYWGTFNASFYLLDAMRYLLDVLRGDDAVLFIDPDCLFVDSSEKLYQRLCADGVINYRIDYQPNQPVHGMSRQDLLDVLRETVPSETKVGDLPSYIGGELYGFTGAALEKVYAAAEVVWHASLERHKRGQKKCNTEEHLLICAFHTLKAPQGNANGMVRRIWTAPIHRNVQAGDTGLVVWHLPFEKKWGLSVLAEHALNEASLFWTLGPADFRRWIGLFFGIPRRTPRRFLFELGWSVGHGIKNVITRGR